MLPDVSARPTRIAIACQGGGSHTAFTAGVLCRLLDDWDERYELVGISGTSGGAFNALAVWYGLVTDGPAAARDIVTAVWDDLAATGRADRLANEWVADGTVPDAQFSHIDIDRIELGRELGYATTVERRPEFLDGLRALGRERAAAFLAGRDV